MIVEGLRQLNATLSVVKFLLRKASRKFSVSKVIWLGSNCSRVAA